MKSTIKTVLAVIIMPFGFSIGVANASPSNNDHTSNAVSIEMQNTSYDVIAKGQNHLPEKDSDKTCS